MKAQKKAIRGWGSAISIYSQDLCRCCNVKPSAEILSTYIYPHLSEKIYFRVYTKNYLRFKIYFLANYPRKALEEKAFTPLRELS